MLHVKEGINNLYATLSERESVASSVYIMEVTPAEARANKKTVTLTDATVDGDRLNKVLMKVVTDKTQEDLTGGSVHLTGGDYIYRIYNQDDKTLEQGMLRFDTSAEEKHYEQNSVTETVYNGE